ncbi:MAG: 23S rRNA (uracil(1939)-C(5))-methyltransferase RlmD [Lachnospiraceae bacterium]|nr:23S rRNA (uracil(1939)-C(5))-methyltransferase RlmD [Lachnospiraceae bacterium]
MKKGEIYQGIVVRIDFPNKGIVIVDGVNVTVKNALPGQTVSFRITKKRNGQAEGKLLEVVEKAPCEKEYLRRIEEGKEENAAAGCSGKGDICRYAGICGGCLYQGFPYEEQLKIKEGQVMKLLGAYLSRLKPSNGDAALNETACNGETAEVLYDGIMPSPKQYGYRNKMEFTFGDETKDGLLSLGLHKRGSFYDILTVSDCLIMDEDYQKILMFTRDYFAERNIPYFHRMNHTGYLRHLLVRKAARTGEILVALVTSTQMKVDLEPWMDGILEMFGQCRDDQKEMQNADNQKGIIQGILHIENDSLADAVKCDRQNILYGTDAISEELLGLQFSISAFSFFQTNSLGAEVLYELVREYVQGKEAGSVVYDLYSGTGTIAQMLAPAAKKVIGVEIVEDAVEAAKKNAAGNGLNNCEFLAGDVLKVLDEITEKPDYIILDPPRDGIHPKALQKIIGYGVENMVYISCKPTSLARDLGPLTEAGYEIRRLGMVDMFPGTGNVETVVGLSLKKDTPKIEVTIEPNEESK